LQFHPDFFVEASERCDFDFVRGLLTSVTGSCQVSCTLMLFLFILVFDGLSEEQLNQFSPCSPAPFSHKGTAGHVFIFVPFSHNDRCRSAFPQRPLPFRFPTTTVAVLLSHNDRCRSAFLQRPLPFRFPTTTVAVPLSYNDCCQGSAVD
jgi:hypothetical protein